MSVDLEGLRAKTFKQNLATLEGIAATPATASITKDMLNFLKYMGGTIDSLMNDKEITAQAMHALEAKNAALETRIKELEESSTARQAITQPSYSAKVNGNLPKETIQMIADVAVQQAKKSKAIENNIVISGIKPKINQDKTTDDAHDVSEVDKVLRKLEIDRSDVVKQTRLITNTNNIIVVEFNNISDKSTAVNNAKKLRTSREFNGIYVNEDKTPEERGADRERRIACKKLNQEQCTQTDGQGRLFGIDGDKHFFYMVRDGRVARFAFTPK